MNNIIIMNSFFILFKTNKKEIHIEILFSSTIKSNKQINIKHNK